MHAPMKKQAKKLAKQGRFGDKHLLHVNDEELEFLRRAGRLHKNPITGLPEAWHPFSGDFSLSDSYTNVRDAVEAYAGGMMFGIPLAGEAASNYSANNPGTPLAEGLQDIGGAAILGGGIALGGAAYGGAPMWGAEAAEAAAPELLSGPAVTSSEATTASFGGPGETLISGGADTGAVSGAAGADALVDSSALAGLPAGAAAAGGSGGAAAASGMSPIMAGFLGLNALSSGYGLYQSYQLDKQRKQQLARQREYQDRLNQLLSNPESIKQNPGYQFGLDEGTKALQRRMASMGYNKSGNLAVATQRYGTDYATNALDHERAILAQAYGMSGPSVNYMDPINLVGRSLANLGYGISRM